MKNSLSTDRWSHILIPSLILGALAWYAWTRGILPLTALLASLSLVNAGFMLFFFRDPERSSNAEADLVLAGADGTIRCIERIEDPQYLGEPATRISIYLSPSDVHINRSPIQGRIKQLSYTPGKHLLTRDNAASEHNEHSSILIEGTQIDCRVHQIVGPIVRRVKYWLDEGQDIGRGERIGLMKFGSRLDMYFPASKIEVLIKEGQQVSAGITPVARCI